MPYTHKFNDVRNKAMANKKSYATKKNVSKSKLINFDTNPSLDKDRRLNKFRGNFSSKDGEDGILSYLLKPFKVNKTCLEVGAWDGVEGSNTFYLRKFHSFSSILIEVDEELYSKLELLADYKTFTYKKYIAAKGKGQDTIDYFIKRHFKNLGVLSLDIDSNDLEVFENLTHKPTIVIIEYNRKFPPHIDYQDPPNMVYFRHSAKAVERVAMKKGYRVVASSADNLILLNKDVINKKNEEFIPNLSVEKILDTPKKNKLGLIPCKQWTYRYLTMKKPNIIFKGFFIFIFAFKFLQNIKRGIRYQKSFILPKAVISKIKESGLFII